MKKIDYPLALFKFLITGLLFSLIILKFFGLSIEGLIAGKKAKIEQDIISYGGSSSEVNKYIKKQNSKIIEIQQLKEEKLQEINTSLIFTNDTTKSAYATIQENRVFNNDDYEDPYRIGSSYLYKLKENVKNIDAYLTEHIFLGFNIFYKDSISKVEFKLKNINDIETKTNYTTTTKYKIVQFYYYTDKQKENIVKQINRDNIKNYFGMSKEERIEKVNQQQFAKVIITEDDLQNQSIEKCSDIFACLKIPKIGSFQNSLYYFSCYNKKLDNETFNKKIKLFKTMFIKKEREDLKGVTKTIKIINPTILDYSNN